MKRRDFLTGCGLLFGAVLTGCGLFRKPDEFVVDGEYTAYFAESNSFPLQRQYVVFEDLPLARFGNHVPHISGVHITRADSEYIYSGSSLFPLVCAREIEERVYHTGRVEDKPFYSYHATFACDVAPDITIERLWLDGKEIVKGGDETDRFRFQVYLVSDQLMHSVPMAAGDDLIDHIKKIGRPA